jgi:hypothetical protein
MYAIYHVWPTLLRLDLLVRSIAGDAYGELGTVELMESESAMDGGRLARLARSLPYWRCTLAISVSDFWGFSQSQVRPAIRIWSRWVNLSSVYLSSELVLIDTQTVHRPGVL